jgi:hypothetical protein
LDVEVSRRKFGQAMASLGEEASDFVRQRGWVVSNADYPTFAVVFTHAKSGRAVGFRFLFDNWDEEPPSLSLFDPESGHEHPWDKWPKNGWAAGNPHSRTGKPFLCLPGIREYHTHESHLNDKWDDLRGRDTYKLLHIVERVRQKFEDTDG